MHIHHNMNGRKIITLKSLDYWGFSLLHSFRFEAEKLTKEETEVFEPHTKEQMLTKPCQVEVIQLNDPCRFL